MIRSVRFSVHENHLQGWLQHCWILLPEFLTELMGPHMCTSSRFHVMPMQQAGRKMGGQVDIGRVSLNTSMKVRLLGLTSLGRCSIIAETSQAGLPSLTRTHTTSSSKVSSAVVATKLQSHPLLLLGSVFCLPP